MTGRLPRAGNFVDDLIRINFLDAAGFSRFAFAPGMLFDRAETWWAGTDLRTSRHEGLDLCYFDSADGKMLRLGEETIVPAVFTGEVVYIMDDFLGSTVVTATPAENLFPGVLLTFYAHILPNDSLGMGDRLIAGEPFARIAPVKSKKTPLPPHLHLSFAGSDRLPPVQTLSWPVLNRVDRSAFFDPLEIIDCPYRILDAAPEPVPAAVDYKFNTRRR